MSASSSHGEDVEDVVRLGSEATTPRTNLTTQSNNDANDGDGNGGDMYRCFSYSSVNMTETEQGHESLLEPPAWKPPEQDEIDYTDAWNSAYGNNQSHFLRPFAAKDDSTIGSNQTNNSNSNSLFAHCGNSLSSGQGGLRPRGFSIHSNNDSIEISTQPQQTIHRRYPSLPGSSKPPQPGHHRQPSLPKNIFSTQPTAHHPLLPPTIVSTETTHQHQKPRHESSHQTKTSDQSRKLIQSSTQHTPYEVNSSHHTSQVLADAALAGLTGAFIDLYAIDRSVDAATATMLATKDDDERERKTALGTLHDVQCILDLYRVDKLADRFKIDLQMPLFMEEEAWVHDVYKDLRKIDVEMELHARRTNATEKNAADIAAAQIRNGMNQKEDFHFDLSDSDDEDLGGESILMKTESFVTKDDPYRFFDPHETAALRTSKCPASEICASTNDDLRDVIELLKTDVEIDGASRRHAQMEMIQPLLETDQEIRKRRERSALQEMWSDELKALYAVDIEVDRAKTMNTTSKQAEPGSPDVKIEKTEPVTDASQEVKEALARHIPNVSQPFCPTSPEPRKINVSAPLTSPEPSRRSVFQPQEEEQSMKKANSAPKRSIFTQKEKNSAMSALRGASMMPGTTTVVTKGGEMIDDIPIGKIKLPDFQSLNAS